MVGLDKEDLILKDKIAERVKFLREQTGLSQTDFAKKYDIDRQIINRWESKTNNRGITIYTIQKFTNMLGISLKEFFDFDNK
ncbi:helix-turn-helix transcriptional regulator [Mariniflexile litorale]|uniref:Helix-turn-helix transcriptional regulator n=1 Tax=Mariniflexile litorale TaxID=3045158 RepID=A0AAU7EF00_9FLAO|nr:helix-turn-helix transcriptional regulator [Mariniflexile sp. KMM 9835]MDQ8213473.1 helix-turn-helix transcriptional regulator [Mariniflexile sp. KMM 9835]